MDKPVGVREWKSKVFFLQLYDSFIKFQTESQKLFPLQPAYFFSGSSISVQGILDITANYIEFWHANLW